MRHADIFQFKAILDRRGSRPVTVVFSTQMDRDMHGVVFCVSTAPKFCPDLGSRLPQFVNFDISEGDILVCLCTPTCTKPK